jgi:hypothetical protein
MDILSLVITFILAYAVFMGMAYGLARLFFPAADTEDGEPEAKPKEGRMRSRRVTGRVLR